MTLSTKEAAMLQTTLPQPKSAGTTGPAASWLVLVSM